MRPGRVLRPAGRCQVVRGQFTGCLESPNHRPSARRHGERCAAAVVPGPGASGGRVRGPTSHGSHCCFWDLRGQNLGSPGTVVEPFRPEEGWVDFGAGWERPSQSSALSLAQDEVTAPVPPLPAYPVGGLRTRFPGARTDRPAGRALGGERRLSRGPGWPPKSDGTRSAVRRVRSASRGRREVRRARPPGRAGWQRGKAEPWSGWRPRAGRLFAR